MATVTSFTDEVSNYVKGAEKSNNTTFIDKQILRILRDWCEETFCWRYVLADISVVDEDKDYTLTTISTDGANEIVATDWVKYKADGLDDDQFTFLNPWNLETEEVASGTGISAGYVYGEGNAPEVYWLDPDKTLQIRPIPNATAAGTDNMRVKVFVKPTLAATSVPTFIYNDYLEDIALGVAGRILKMASYKWYEPKLGDKYWGEYLAKRNSEGRRQRWEGQTRTQGHVRIHRGFSGGHRQKNWIF